MTPADGVPGHLCFKVCVVMEFAGDNNAGCRELSAFQLPQMGVNNESWCASLLAESALLSTEKQ